MKKFLCLLSSLFLLFSPALAYAAKPLDDFHGRPPIHLRQPQSPNSTTPSGYTPQQIWAAYGLPGTGGTGTIAIIDAYDYPTAQSDLNTFSTQYGLPAANFEKHLMANKIRTNSGWALEAALDTQWAHAIAPNAKILLVEAKSNSGTDLLNAVNYARSRPDVVAISMSWGGGEFSSEALYDSYFVSSFGATFFASSGDAGNGVEWPAVSPNVVGVGGTTLNMNGITFGSEIAWSGSGGGRSLYESEPSYQVSYSVPGANGKRAVPDVSYDADPNTGFPVYDSTGYQGIYGWITVGGTSAGSPQWAAIRALDSNGFAGSGLYGSPLTSFRDIISGSNGGCGFYCNAVAGYDYVTGLGSPLTTNY